jgi:hypothetical protein
MFHVSTHVAAKEKLVPHTGRNIASTWKVHGTRYISLLNKNGENKTKKDVDPANEPFKAENTQEKGDTEDR